MSDQTSTGAAVVANEAPNTEAAQTHAADTPDLDTQDGTGEEEGTAEAKTFTQEELNDIVKKEKAKAEAKAERRVLKALERLTPQQAQAQQHHQAVDTSGEPQRENFSSDAAYLRAAVSYEVDMRERASGQSKAQQHQESINKRTASMYAEASKVAGFDREDFDSLPLTPVIAQTLLESDQSPRLMAYMCEHPEEVDRIVALSPARQAAELGKLESKFASSPKTSKAPAPITPIGGRGAGPTSDLSRLSMDDYIKQRAKQGARWAR